MAFAALVGLAPAQGLASSNGPRPIDACMLLTSHELSEVLGMPVEAGMRHDAGRTSGDGYSSTCVWKVHNARLTTHDPKASFGGADYAILNVISWPSRSGAELLLRTLRTAADRNLIPMHPVPLDLGEESVWWGDGVAVRIGTVSFGISVALHAANRNQRRKWEEMLARKILVRMPPSR